MTTPASLSLRQLRWLPVITDAGTELLTLDEAFIRAHEIRRVDTRDPIMRGALNRFLISVGVLVARAADITTKSAPTFGRDGFPTETITAALDQIDDHLWLMHPDTPFMQLPILEDLYLESDSKNKSRVPAAEIFPRTPGGSGKVWFDKPGDVFNNSGLTPEEAAVGLIAHWFYSPSSNIRTMQLIEKPDENGELIEETVAWRHLGTIGTAGLKVGRALTFWHRGQTLSEFLMLNIAKYWLEESSLPAWASVYSTSHPSSSIAEHTYSGNAVHLTFDPETGTFPTAVRGGFPHGTNVSTAKEAAKEQLAAACDEDPTRVWQDIITSKKTTVRILFHGFELSNSTAQNLKSWFVDGAQPAIRHGVMISRTRELDVLYMAATPSKFNTPEIIGANWMTFSGSELEAEAVAKELVTELAETCARRPEAALARAVAIAFPATGKPARLPDHYFAALRTSTRAFHVELEPLFGHAVAQAVAGIDPESLVADVISAQVEAYDRAMAPYLHARTLASISRGRATLTGPPVAMSTENIGDPVVAFTGRFARQSRTDTRLRVAVSRGIRDVTEYAAAPYLHQLDELCDAERIGATRALGILASHHSLIHQGGRRLGSALAYLTWANRESFISDSGVAAKVGLLPYLDLDEAVTVLDGLVGRLGAAGLGVSFHDVVHTLRFWDQADFTSQTDHRNSTTYLYHASNQKAAA